MPTFEQSRIWQSTLAPQQNDPYAKEHAHLRNAFDAFRERAKVLAGEIHRDLPDFTVHDIKHIDALWEMADLVLAEDDHLNPAEAFVLGGTFLLHDLGMGLAAYPDGVGALTETTIYKDAVAAFFKKQHDRPIQAADYDNIDGEVHKQAVAHTLRVLHAEQAEKLALVHWTKPDSEEQLYLLQDAELRNTYGHLLGLIAHSHHWQVEELPHKLNKESLPAPGHLPAAWMVDGIKLACLLRIADAIQLDDRRAPLYLWALRKPGAYSNLHWNFQNKLLRPALQHNKVRFGVKAPFSHAEAASWWQCHDTLHMVHNELQGVDALLTDLGKKQLNANGVLAIEAPDRLAQHIGTAGWQPVDARLQVTNIGKLIERFGGKELYGENYWVPIRELIQNAADAIRARRLLEEFEPEFGTVTISLLENEYGQYLEVLDNGVGMSERVLTGPLLDFGNSFWGTEAMHHELPGLQSLGFSSTGQYGIGFFSVFMLGQRVTVTSKRFEKGREESITLEFTEGTYSRPLLRDANKDELIKDGGTRVRIWVNNDTLNKALNKQTGYSEKILEKNMRYSMGIMERQEGYSKKTLEGNIRHNCIAMDCNVVVNEKGSKVKVVKANDWLTISGASFLHRIKLETDFKIVRRNHSQGLSREDFTKLESILENIAEANTREIKDIDTGEALGRGFIPPELWFKYSWSFPEEACYYNIGGIRGEHCKLNIAGLIAANPTKAARDEHAIKINNRSLAKWATQQAALINKLECSDFIKALCYINVARLGGESSGLNLFYYQNSYTSINGLRNKLDQDYYIIITTLFKEDHSTEEELDVKCSDNMIFMIDRFGYRYSSDEDDKIMKITPVVDGTPCSLEFILNLLAEKWNCEKCDLAPRVITYNFALGNVDTLDSKRGDKPNGLLCIKPGTPHPFGWE